MGYWINLDSTGNTAHRDDILEYEGIYWNCNPDRGKNNPPWPHTNTSPQFNSGKDVTIEIEGHRVKVKPCGNCHPW